MDVQVIALRAVLSVLRKEPIMAGGPYSLQYVMSKCPAQGPSYLYGTLPWNLSHGTRNFRERHCRSAA